MAKIEPVESSTSQLLSTLKPKNEVSDTSKISSKDKSLSRKQTAPPASTGNQPVEVTYTKAEIATVRQAFLHENPASEFMSIYSCVPRFFTSVHKLGAQVDVLASA